MQRNMYQRPSDVSTSFSKDVKFLSTVAAMAIGSTSMNLFEIWLTGRPTSEGIKFNSVVAEGVKRRTEKPLSKKSVPTSEEFRKLAKSSLVLFSSSTLSLS